MPKGETRHEQTKTSIILLVIATKNATVNDITNIDVSALSWKNVEILRLIQPPLDGTLLKVFNYDKQQLQS